MQASIAAGCIVYVSKRDRSSEILVIISIRSRVKTVHKLLGLARNLKCNRRQLVNGARALSRSSVQSGAAFVQDLDDGLGTLPQSFVAAALVNKVLGGGDDVGDNVGDSRDVGLHGGQTVLGADAGNQGLDGLNEAVGLVFDI